MAWDKEKDLEIKYRYIPDDAANAPVAARKKTVKKADHKHLYKPICIDYYGRYGGWTTFYGSYCPICGKINTDNMGSAERELDALFPKKQNSLWKRGFQEENGFEEYCKKHYKYIVMKDFDLFKTKFLPQEYMD